MKIPKALSKLEETFALHLFSAALPEMPEREYRFHGARKWRFDFAWPARKLAVEIEGGIHNGGRHVTAKGFEADAEKYNQAALLGWKVLRFTGHQVNSLQAIKITQEALKA